MPNKLHARVEGIDIWCGAVNWDEVKHVHVLTDVQKRGQVVGGNRAVNYSIPQSDVYLAGSGVAQLEQQPEWWDRTEEEARQLLQQGLTEAAPERERVYGADRLDCLGPTS